ncbi:MAG TPA: metal ABC transporter permease [Burkholderiales bacterium]|nr:metal ABC transporter permease [Burkholderiales bacterium]
MSSLDLLWPAFVAGLLVTATHAPLGMQVLARGIVFIDLAVAQIAGLGVVLADTLGYPPHGVVVQAAALGAALAAALFFGWTERRWPQVQEAVIGVAFVVAANAAILLLAANPRGAEQLQDLLAGQILWVNPVVLPWIALVTAALLAAWFGLGARLGRTGFYLVFACAVTVSVQLVGLYLVFATLIVPALATRGFARGRLAACYALGALGYAGGLGLSLLADLPAGPLVVCTMTALGAAVFLGRFRGST